MKPYLIILAYISICSCTAVRKSINSHQATTQQTDNSTINSGYTKETTVTETGSDQLNVPGDSITATGYVPAGDAGAAESESDGMTITTTTTPIKDSTGKTIGNKISTRATVKPRTVSAPINKTTHIIEAGKTEERKDIATTVQVQDKSTAKRVWRPSAGVQIIIALVVILSLILGIYKMIRK
ncbi:hypothetical protein FHW36_10686 [Chitinophaga polysaccharea]|uniref:Uncharacterized protein n=1 Tax=Chitinophaga polysaccharea TaxID=1293035 RepID=A0A561PL70_9BACT|nr:hypothetical protein [Chitinophaga polysaccharea]TWF38863.1 hypothetical protein FHW36_10686 [Chitinophaga polysaccharea]